MRLLSNFPSTTTSNKIASQLSQPQLSKMCSTGDPMEIDSVLSDDSSFYGDEDEKARLSQQAASYDPEPYWSTIHPNALSTIQYGLRKVESSSNPGQALSSENAEQPASVIQNNQRGRTETIQHFLHRLPPSKTLISDVGPWIWMFGPTSKAQLDQDVPAFLRKGTALLRDFEDVSAELRAAHEKSGAKTTATLTRKLNPLRRNLEQDILNAARECGVIYGKWMLFPNSRDVDRTWKTVVTALDKGELGDGAKVATDDGSGSSRLICVYTKDFGDKQDVKRVLRGMVSVGLVDTQDRPIYYKCDAYTHLDITYKNDYGLKASMFSSRDLLG